MYFPSKLVTADVFDFLMKMLAPGSGAEFTSVTVPVIVLCCAMVTKHISIAMADEISFRLFMIVSFKN